MIKWNEEYKVYVSDEGHVYNKEMKEYKLWPTKDGYLRLETHRNIKMIHKQVHRLVYETFVGKIPDGLQVDHVNRVRSDNRLENLRVVTRSENHLNRSNNSEFGRKYFEHFGYSKSENQNQYAREYFWYKRHNNTCRWE